MSTVKSHNYPAYESSSDFLGISASTSIPASARIVSISGAVAMDASDREKPLPSTHAQQFELAMENAEKALAAASPHLSREQLWAGVFTATSFHVGPLKEEDRHALFAVAKKWFSIGNNRPCWTAIGVLELFGPNLLVEIKMQAAYEN